MNTSLRLVLAVMALASVAAIGLGLLIHWMHVRRLEAADPDEPLSGDGMGAAVGYISAAAAFLLGILMLGSLDHFNQTGNIVADEALAYSTAFDSADGLPKDDKPIIQRDLICLMRSVATHSWGAAEANDLTGSDTTHAWRRRTSAHARDIAPKTRGEEDSLASLQSGLIDASKSGQQRLLAAESKLPLALWILVFISLFVLTAIFVALMRAHPSPILAITTMAAVLIVNTAMVYTLTTFDEPFTKGDGVYISPRALNAVMVRLQATYPDANWSPCEAIADR